MFTSIFYLLPMVVWILFITADLIHTKMKSLIDEHGKRAAIFIYICGFLAGFIPIINLLLIISLTGENIKEWLDKDPTAPKNRDNPDFVVPEPKKKKKERPIKSRAEILDI